MFGNLLNKVKSVGSKTLGAVGGIVKKFGDVSGDAVKTIGNGLSRAAPVISGIGNALAPETGGISSVVAGALNKGIDYIKGHQEQAQNLASKISQVGTNLQNKFQST